MPFSVIVCLIELWMEGEEENSMSRPLNYDLDKRLSLLFALNSAVPFITRSTTHIPNILCLT